MMTAQEEAKWRKEKTDIVAEYQAGLKQALSGTAARGFTHAPGTLYEFITDAELITKRKLSALNYAILSETIEQEIKQSGADYSLAFQNAVVAWELEKQELLSALQKEIARTKQEMAFDEEALNQLAIEVSKRENVLIEQKTAIKVAMEGYRKAIAELGSNTGEYEVALANAKILTAQRKLDVIPLLKTLVDIEKNIVNKEIELVNLNKDIVTKEESLLAAENLVTEKMEEVVTKTTELIASENGLLTKENEVLIQEQNKVSANTALISAQEDIVNEKIEVLTPAIQALINIYEEYATEIANQVVLLNQIAAVKAETATIEAEKIIKYNALVEKQRTLTQKYSELIAAKSDLIEYRTVALGQAIENLVAAYDSYKTELITQIRLKEQILEQERLAASIEKDKITRQLEISNLENEIALLKTALFTADSAISEARMRARLEINAATTANLGEIAEIKTEVFASTFEAESSSLETIKQNKLEEDSTRFNISLESLQTTEGAKRSYIDQIRDVEINKIETIADYEAAPKLTATLTHLLEI